MNFQRLLCLLLSLSLLASSGFAQDAAGTAPGVEAAVQPATDAAELAVAAEGSSFDFLDAGAGKLVGWLSYVFFAPVPLGGGRSIPLVVIWLVLGSIFFTVRMGFINLRGFGHAIQVTRGKFTDPHSQGEGEVTHFQALASALSATVGLGNIAGVAIAVATGGPGAIF